MSSRYPHVAAAVFSVPWLIHPPVMDVVVDVLARRIAGERLSRDEIDERLASARQAGPRGGSRRAGAVAVLPIYGILAHRAEYFADTSTNGTSVQALQRAFREALADPEVAAILFDVDSPGGQVSGIPELAEEIRAARGQKPIGAVSNTLNASAAYFLSSQVDELTVTPSSLTGSVGVVMAHEDWTGHLEQEGVKVSLIHAGEHKVEMYPQTPLSDEARAHLQGLVDDVHDQFVAAVAKGRGVSATTVRADFGKGRVLTPREAVRVGMADRVGTFESALTRLAQGKVKPRGMAAEDGYIERRTYSDEQIATMGAALTSASLSDPTLSADQQDDGDEVEVERERVAAERRRRM